MKFARIGALGAEVPAVQVAEAQGWLDLRPLTADVDGAFLGSDPVARVQAAVAAGDLPPLEVAQDGERFGAPVTKPGAIVCIGMNYAAHARESGAEPPERPVIFLKHANTLAGPFDDVVVPPTSRKLDWEVELAVVIGTRASYLADPSESLSHVAGFAVANDLSEREWQLELSGGQWCKGKSVPGSTPLGPWLVTPDEVDHAALGLRTKVNGVTCQDSSTSDLIFSVEQIVWQLSQYMVLDPGDVVLTGTPEGVALSGRFPYLVPGDRMELEVDGLGSQAQVCVAHGAGQGA
ncbi:fumarylacetoacetate hydrolase family protein [Nocardioides sp. GY 10127]|uniref:fumarylacetoacetate hydrolase family protein n=1 Tax=Nocardioides sp. GY 10127 TaxID=2569762 RepID=UPI0010A94139|nr:fumarylacetoacetate hydrolase family protein [Nocardioides sp. GY 10127]TIC79341.1 fumarylacetoacetate hydrolase family protein [Nocardioides sp. GY 10127]